MTVVAPMPTPTVATIARVSSGDAAETTQADAKVTHEIGEHQRALHALLLSDRLLPAIPPRVFEIAEPPERFTVRRARGHARRLQFLGAHLQMHAQLLVHVGGHSSGPAPQVPERPA